MYLSAFVVSIAAVTSGLLLHENGAYAPGDLGLHKWTAISSMVLALVLGYLKWNPDRLSPKVNYGLSVGLILLISVAGHYGGVLTHGNDYLYEYAPGWFQSTVGYTPHSDLAELSAEPPDSIQLYVDVVRPILESKCVRCHGDAEISGGFNAEHYSTLFEEGETGTGVVPGSITGSEMFRRVTLPTSSVRFMPPNGDPLSYTELSVLRYWIGQGADSAARFDYETMDDELARLVKRDYLLDFTPKPYYEKVVVDSLSPEMFRSLVEGGFEASYLGGDNYLLDVQFTKDTLQEGDISVLSTVADNVTFLDLSDVVIEDTALADLTSLKNLTRLDLHGSSVSDNIFTGFSNIQHLEVLNLFKSDVGDEGLENALASPALKRVYVWQTNISEETVDRLTSEYPDIEFDRGFTFVAPDTTATSSGTP